MFAFTQKIIKYLEKNLFVEKKEIPIVNSQILSQFKFGQKPNDEKSKVDQKKDEEVVEDSGSSINVIPEEEPLENESPTKVESNYVRPTNIEINVGPIESNEQTKGLMNMPPNIKAPDEFEPLNPNYPVTSSVQVTPKSGVIQHMSILKTRSTKTSPKRQTKARFDSDMSNESVCVKTLSYAQSESGFMTLFNLHQSRRHRLFGKKNI